MHRVAIPTDEHGRWLAHFGRAPRMLVITVEGGVATSREERVNPDPHHLDRAHERVMLDLVDGCDVVHANHIGAPMIATLTSAGTRVLGVPSESVDAALEAYLRSENGGPPLEVLRPSDGVHHGARR